MPPCPLAGGLSRPPSQFPEGAPVSARSARTACLLLLQAALMAHQKPWPSHSDQQDLQRTGAQKNLKHLWTTSFDGLDLAHIVQGRFAHTWSNWATTIRHGVYVWPPVVSGQAKDQRSKRADHRLQRWTAPCCVPCCHAGSCGSGNTGKTPNKWGYPKTRGFIHGSIAFKCFQYYTASMTWIFFGLPQI